MYHFVVYKCFIFFDGFVFQNHKRKNRNTCNIFWCEIFYKPWTDQNKHCIIYLFVLPKRVNDDLFDIKL